MRRFRPAILPAALLVLAYASPALAADGVSQVQNFITNIIQVLTTLAGLIAAGFFVVGGISYITSSGHPEKLDRAKQTIIYSGLGLAIALGAFVLTSVVSDAASKSFGG